MCRLLMSYPKNFQDHSENLQPTVLKQVFELISPFLSTLTLNDLQVELQNYSKIHDKCRQFYIQKSAKH